MRSFPCFGKGKSPGGTGRELRVRIPICLENLQKPPLKTSSSSKTHSSSNNCVYPAFQIHRGGVRKEKLPFFCVVFREIQGTFARPHQTQKHSFLHPYRLNMFFGNENKAYMSGFTSHLVDTASIFSPHCSWTVPLSFELSFYAFLQHFIPDDGPRPVVNQKCPTVLSSPCSTTIAISEEEHHDPFVLSAGITTLPSYPPAQEFTCREVPLPKNKESSSFVHFRSLRVADFEKGWLPGLEHFSFVYQRVIMFWCRHRRLHRLNLARSSAARSCFSPRKDIEPNSAVYHQGVQGWRLISTFLGTAFFLQCIRIHSPLGGVPAQVARKLPTCEGRV